MDRPVIFLSAVSAEFRELRQLLHDSFKTHFHVITQDDTLHPFPGGDVRQLLSDAIDGSHAVLHLAGAGFGSTAAAPFPEMPGFLCSWTQYEYYYAHSFDADPARRKQIFAIVCGPTLRSPTFTEKDDATLTADQKAPLQEAHCQRIFSGKFDATPLASLPRTVNHGHPINDNAAALRAAIDICAQLATRQPAFQSACALVQVSLQEKLQPLLDAQLRLEKKQKRLLLLSLCTLAALALIGGGIWLLLRQQERTDARLASTYQQLDLLDQKVEARFTRERGYMALILARSNERLKDWETMPPAIRFDLALGEIAAEQKIPANELRALLDLYVSLVEAEQNPDAEDLYYVQMRQQAFAEAAKTAGTEAEAAISRMKAAQTKAQAAQTIADRESEMATEERKRAIDFFTKEGNAHFSAGDYRKALAAFEKSAALLDPAIQTLDWADAKILVSVCLHVLADHAKAEQLMKEILAVRESKLPKDDPSIAKSLNLLAGLYLYTNRQKEAEPLFERALRIDEAAYGKDHPTVATSLNNLATLYNSTNRLKEAEPLMKRALRIDEAAFGKDHPALTRHLNNLAALYYATYRLKEAEPLMERALRIDEAAFGEDHPTVATSLNNLATLYSCQLAQLYNNTNRLKEAEPLLERALRIDEVAFGKDHPTVAIRLNNLARLYQATNRLKEAESLSRRALGIFLSSQVRNGHRDPNTLVMLDNYFSIARALNLPDSETHTRLAAEGQQAGLEPAAFEALWAEALAENYAGPYLVTVDEAVAGGQGIALGIQPGDVILRYHGQAITSVAQFIQLTGEVKDEAIPLEIQRGKEILKLTAKPGKLGVKIQNVMPPTPAE